MPLKLILEQAVRYLEENAVGSPRRNAEMLMMFVLGCDRAYLYAHPERELTAVERERYQEALAERARGVPTQYITGHQEFWGLDLMVSPAVLIPRPETEHVVEATLELARGAPSPRIVDVGTGSGAIALALAHELPEAHIWAVDISPAALEMSRANAARLELNGRVQFVESDLLACFDESERFDFVVSNPPYVGDEEQDKVQREVRKFEPRVSVFAGPEGMDTIRRLIPQAHAHLSPGGWLLVEMGFTQEQRVRRLLPGEWTEVRAVPDLQGIPRVMVARKPPCA